MAIDKSSFQGIALTVGLDTSRKLESIQVEIVAENVKTAGALYVTDVMLQGGTVATSHVGNASEIRWSFENA